MSAQARVGISGWVYPPWRGVFCPPGLPHRAELGYAAARLGSIEINGSFYSMQRPASWRSWREQTPDGFVFAVKGPRFITHLKRLRDCREALANFLASGILALGPKLGPILWQLPPRGEYDREVVEAFLALLPRTTGEALELARERDVERMRDREHLDIDSDAPLQHAMEVRHPSFDTADFFDSLERHGVASVVAETAGRWPSIDRVTTDFVYARLHGDTELYVSGYDAPALDRWAERVRGWTASGLDAYVYFDNDVKVRSPVDAMALAARLA